MRLASILAAITALATSAVAVAEDFSWQFGGFGALGLGSFDAPQSWLDGGFGRLADGDAGRHAQGALDAAFAFDWEFRLLWSGRVHLVGSAEGARAGGRRTGLTEAFVQRIWFSGNQAHWRLRAGLHFLSTSMENVDPLWQSPYTQTLSALNSWIGEEFRPLGIEVSRSVEGEDGRRLELAAGTFAGNDTSGALLAWRGFALHRRLARFGETLPLPPLPSLAPGAPFGDQNTRGSRAVGSDLDGRAGYYLRAQWQARPELLTSALWADNRGDRDLHGGDYSWRTRFGQLGFEWLPSPRWTLAGEWLWGESGMGFAPDPFAEIAFSTTYLLASWQRNDWRLSLRGERFSVRDLDRSAAENNDERGHALTVALFRSLGTHWRLGVEALSVHGRRPAAAEAGFEDQAGGDSLRIELRRVWQ